VIIPFDDISSVIDGNITILDDIRPIFDDKSDTYFETFLYIVLACGV
jgi:hypothetical protein